MNHIDELREHAVRLHVASICHYILDDLRFISWSGSSRVGQHHYGTGGLLRHTHEVVSMCLLMREKFYPDLDEEILFLSALFHDYGKMFDYRPEPNCPVSEIDEETLWVSTEHKRKIHHISRSVIEWNKLASQFDSYSKIADEVTHAILSHHCERAWGSPVAPKTRIAWLLHLCDNISARMNDCETRDLYSG